MLNAALPRIITIFPLQSLHGTLAVDAMLPDEGHRVGDQVHGDSEASARHAHALFEVFQFFLLFVEDGHGQIVVGM